MAPEPTIKAPTISMERVTGEIGLLKRTGSGTASA